MSESEIEESIRKTNESCRSIFIIVLWTIVNWTATWMYLYSIRGNTGVMAGPDVYFLAVIWPCLWLVIAFIFPAIALNQPPLWYWKDLAMKGLIYFLALMAISLAATHFTLVSFNAIAAGSDAHVNFNSLWIMVGLWTTALGTILGTVILSAYDSL